MQAVFGEPDDSFAFQEKHSRRRQSLGIVLSLLAHVILLIFILQHSNMPKGAQPASRSGTLVMLSEPSHKASVPKKMARSHHRKTAPPVKKPRVNPVAITEPPQPSEQEPAPVVETPPMDMMAMINAKREARRRANPDSANADESAHEPTPEEMAANNIRSEQDRRLGRPTGTNGVFEILHKGPRMAEFSFLGWRDDARHNWRQVIEVDAGPTGDVELAIVRRMIQLIRTHYQGNFNWDSRRLGRVIVLSARPEDNAQLENFLMQEFFHSN